VSSKVPRNISEQCLDIFWDDVAVFASQSVGLLYHKGGLALLILTEWEIVPKIYEATTPRLGNWSACWARRRWRDKSERRLSKSPAASKNIYCARSLFPGKFSNGGRPQTLGVARSNIALRAAGAPSKPKDAPQLPDRKRVDDTRPSWPLRLCTALGVPMPSRVELPEKSDVHCPMPRVSTA
jgi:hypothetical protein